MKNPEISVPMSGRLVTGLTAVYNYINPAVSNFGKQVPPEGIGVEEFEFWCPKRRPESKNIAMSFAPPLASFNSENLRNSYYRPYIGTNAWVAAFDDARPEVCFKWNGRKQIKPLSCTSIPIRIRQWRPSRWGISMLVSRLVTGST